MTQVLRGNIVHAPAMGRLDILEHGCLVLEDGVITGLYPDLPAHLEGAEVRDFGDRIIMQSFADMHLHAPQYPMLGMGMDPPQFLQPGDTVRCEIDGIGSLTNTVR